MTSDTAKEEEALAAGVKSLALGPAPSAECVPGAGTPAGGRGMAAAGAVGAGPAGARASAPRACLASQPMPGLAAGRGLCPAGVQGLFPPSPPPPTAAPRRSPPLPAARTDPAQVQLAAAQRELNEARSRIAVLKHAVEELRVVLAEQATAHARVVAAHAQQARVVAALSQRPQQSGSPWAARCKPGRSCGAAGRSRCRCCHPRCCLERCKRRRRAEGQRGGATARGLWRAWWERQRCARVGRFSHRGRAL